jgi:thioredoxin-related protein
MDSSVYPDQSVMNEVQNFIPVKINVDQQPALAQRYGVSSIPAIVWLDSNGNERKRVVGGYPPAEFVVMMQSAR